MDAANNRASAPNAPALLQSGENLVLVNREFFVQEEKLRMQLKAARDAASRSKEMTGSLQQFTVFNKIPPELRRMIWKLAAKVSRVVEFSYYPKQKTMVSKFPSKTLVPAILHVSSEARACGLEVYEKLDFGSIFDSTYINWELDTVTFEDIRGLKAFLDIEDKIYAASSPSAPMATPTASGQASPKAGLSHSLINLNCRRLAVKSMNGHDCVDLSNSDIAKMKHFYLMDEFILAQCDRQPKQSNQGNIILSGRRIPDWTTFHRCSVDFDTSEDEDLEDLLRKVKNIHGGILKGSIMSASRDNRKLMTLVEKKERQKVKEGKLQLQEAQALKAKRDAAKKTAAQKKKEQQEALRQKQYEEDLILAATLQCQNP